MPVARVSDRTLGLLVWVQILMHRPVLVPEMWTTDIRRVRDVVGRVESLALRVADLLVTEAHAVPVDGTVAAAETVVDECCVFVERWGACPVESEAFNADLRQLRACLDEIARTLVADVA